MKYSVNETHDPSLEGRVKSAHDPRTDFPIQNLPLGVFIRLNCKSRPAIGVAIGDRILDLKQSREKGLLAGLDERLLEGVGSESLNDLMALGPEHWSALRRRISLLLRAGDASRQKAAEIEASLMPMSETRMVMPARIGDYTDFYASIYHARNVGKMFRPDTPLLPNYKYVPIGYHGRASSVVVSGTPVRRPWGQSEGQGAPEFKPSRMLDYELEVGAFIGAGNALGEPVGIREADAHMFGLCLVNDWSARDIQKWEYQPLGPFLAKSFATTISPWIVTMEALAPFRVPAMQRPLGDPAPLPYLADKEDMESGAIDLGLEVFLCPEGNSPVLLSRSNVRDLYWTFAQLLTHHCSNGCNLRPGDLIASGTVSGEGKGTGGCLLELTWRGSEPVKLPQGDTRCFLEDGDEVVMRGRAERDGFVGIGFGECRGRIVPSVDSF